MTPFELMTIRDAVRRLLPLRHSPEALRAARAELGLDEETLMFVDDEFAAALKRMRAEQARIDALPDAYPLPPPGACACFEGHCRAGEVINGRLANGLICKEAARAR